MPVKEDFNKKLKIFHDDVHNAVGEHYSQGWQSLTNCILEDKRLSDPVKLKLEHGIKELSGQICKKLLSSLSYFEESSRACIQRPSKIKGNVLEFKALQEPSMLSNEYGTSIEDQMTETIAKLHRDIARGCADCSSVSRRIRDIDSRIADLREPAECTALSETLSIHQDRISSILKMTSRIQSLLARGREVRLRSRSASMLSQISSIPDSGQGSEELKDDDRDKEKDNKGLRMFSDEEEGEKKENLECQDRNGGASSGSIAVDSVERVLIGKTKEEIGVEGNLGKGGEVQKSDRDFVKGLNHVFMEIEEGGEQGGEGTGEGTGRPWEFNGLLGRGESLASGDSEGGRGDEAAEEEFECRGWRGRGRGSVLREKETSLEGLQIIFGELTY